MIKRGKIILTPFPFTDLSGQKVRPALVVSRNLAGDDVVVVFISSKQKKKHSKHDVFVAMSKQNGLKASSSVKCAKVATLDRRVVLGEIGELSKSDQSKVDKKIRQIIL